MVDILIRRRQNNPILTGEAGVGKTAVVEGLARRIAEGDVPPALKNVVLRTLDLGLLQAGAGVKGEFENRLKQVIAEVKGSPTPIILFIDEAHTMIGAGGAAGQGDAANLLKPALARGELRTIAATTWAEYKKYFEKDAALARRFQVVKVEEPTEDVAVRMMRGLTGDPREAPRRANPRRGRRELRQAVASLHPRTAAARQVGQPARYRLRRGWRSARTPSPPPSRTAAARSITSRSRSASSSASEPPARTTTSGSTLWQRSSKQRRVATGRARGPVGRREETGRGNPRAVPEDRGPVPRKSGRSIHGERPAVPALAGAGRDADRPRDQDERAPQAPGRAPLDAGLASTRRPSPRSSPAGPASPSAR